MGGARLQNRPLEERITVAGFGGQGVVLMGKILAYAGLLESKNVTCLPSYGPEMRGGTANCMVTISKSRIGSPYIANPSSLIAMNEPSLDRFESKVEPEGCILRNASLVKREVARSDVAVADVHATEEAEALGDVRAANMIALGAFIGIKPFLRRQTLLQALGKSLPTGRRDLLALDERAILRGFELARAGVAESG